MAQKIGKGVNKASGLYILLSRQDSPTFHRLTNPILVMETLQKQLAILSSPFLVGLQRERRQCFLGQWIPTHITAESNATVSGCSWKTNIEGMELCLLSASLGTSEVTYEQ